MKVEVLKKIMKEAVKEAISESMKDILLEALTNNKGQMIQENHQPQQVKQPSNSNSEFDRDLFKSQFRNMMENGEISLNSSNVNQPLQVTSLDTTNGSLPQGEVSMDIINKFIK
jgi:hypothetical protein